MTLILELPPEREATLRPMAAEQGKDASEYALSLLDEIMEAKAAEKRPFYETATPEEWIAAYDQWTASLDPNTPVLPDDRREVLYED